MNSGNSLNNSLGDSIEPNQPISECLVQALTWQWQGFAIGYQQAGTAQSNAPAVVLIHGFGASSIHWRKNIPDLAKNCRVYAIDLLGYGKSAKPLPGQPLDYTFETWGRQVVDFCQQVVGSPAFLIGNSIGCVVAMQAAVMAPDQVLGVALLDCSLRLLHDRKRQTLPWYRNAPTPYIQKLLGYKPLISFFFKQLAKPKSVKRILRQAYGRQEEVTDELVSLLLEPAFDEGAIDVFLAFIRYSQGPIPEDLLPQLACPTLILWGTEDPWEPIELARAYADYPAVEDFIELEGLGHCPQDEAPEIVDPILAKWIAQKSA
ncbi:MAG: putative hydrolases or acyltransferases (alpha/beta hydrolase superfamily) [Phormidesmis priestleyi Ana]|uniref:Putative hydrolases or acyltransferases (Alpha/beta hydrolase superfamily) n=1 Tax=Phormidesmis priestleyi Ana TaxID=1666911 RepID=A0A0P8DGH3_9CYAN|nr:MAG: putative hydrolases or acyltransferases (alpha/beta hydrolase superfamily) [Phormidesmis priestleyi Ana]